MADGQIENATTPEANEQAASTLIFDNQSKADEMDSLHAIPVFGTFETCRADLLKDYLMPIPRWAASAAISHARATAAYHDIGWSWQHALRRVVRFLAGVVARE